MVRPLLLGSVRCIAVGCGVRLLSPEPLSVGLAPTMPAMSRFGGILLGPARFTHINNAARELLDACGYIAAKDGASKGGGKGKKR